MALSFRDFCDGNGKPHRPREVVEREGASQLRDPADLDHLPFGDLRRQLLELVGCDDRRVTTARDAAFARERCHPGAAVEPRTASRGRNE